MISDTLSAGASISMVLPIVKTMSKVSVAVNHEVILTKSPGIMKNREDRKIYSINILNDLA